MASLRNVMFDTRKLQKQFKEWGGGVEAAQNACRLVQSLVQPGTGEDGKPKMRPEQFSLRGLAVALGMIDEHDPHVLTHTMEQFHGEANAGVNTNAFKVITSELINAKVIEGYEDDGYFIGEQLVDVMPNQRLRNQRITGFKGLGGPDTVYEGHPYEETSFEEKYVTTKETKKGRILSINEETILFDQTGDLLRRARELGFYIRQEKERTIVRGVIDADSTADPVYRPSGTGEALYAADGSNYNWIGSGNTTSTSFNAASALQDWTDLDHIRKYRATEITDDRIDGTQRALAGLNGPQNVLLVPESIRGTTDYILNQTQTETLTANTAARPNTVTPNPAAGMVGGVLSSPFLDEVSTADYFYGQFKRQFVWTEIWPIQTFEQRADSEAAFERDVVMRLKVRYYGGITSTDTIWCTKIDGV